MPGYWISGDYFRQRQAVGKVLATREKVISRGNTRDATKKRANEIKETTRNAQMEQQKRNIAFISARCVHRLQFY